MRTRLRFSGILLFALLTLASMTIHAAAQVSEPTQVTIVVFDTTGASIAGAQVVLSRANERRAFKTDNDGTVALRSLAPGAWTITVSHEGFVTRQRPLVVQATPVTVTLSLEVAGLRQNVLVEAVRPARASCAAHV